MAERVTWDDNIKDYFTQMDVGCMRARGLDLSDYESVKDSADMIHQQLQARIDNPNRGMPKGGRPWPQEKVNTFKAWMDDGYPKSRAT